MSNSLLSPYHILYVDDEEKALHYFKEIFGDEYTIHIANNAMDGYRILQEYGPRIGLLLTDQRMPGASGVELMEHARKLNPNLIRVLVTAYTDYQAAVDAVNSGRCFRYLHKPWDPEEISVVIKHSLDYYHALVERERLLVEKADTVRHMLSADKVSGLGILAEGLNHHLRNALTVVRAFIDLAPMKLMEEIGGAHPRDPSFWIDVQNQAQSQIERIQSLLARIAEASYAKSAVRDDECTLNGVLDEMISMFATSLQAKNLHVDVEVSPDIPHSKSKAGASVRCGGSSSWKRLPISAPGTAFKSAPKSNATRPGAITSSCMCATPALGRARTSPPTSSTPFTRVAGSPMTSA